MDSKVLNPGGGGGVGGDGPFGGDKFSAGPSPGGQISRANTLTGNNDGGTTHRELKMGGNL